MQSRGHCRSVLIFFSLTLCLSAQSLNQAWQAYMATSADLSTIQSNRDSYFKEQLELKSEGSRLQNSSVWYNAWLNKLLLASNTERQLAIIDSLDRLNGRFDFLLSRQKKELTTLMQTYEQVLASYESKGVVLETERETSRRVGSWLLSQPSDGIQLPDYSDLVQGDYANREIRHLVLQDVKHLLLSKITELDSLLERKAAQAELAGRLADFHQDLGLQMEADQDVQARDVSGETAKNLNWNYSSSPTELADVSGVDGAEGTGASIFDRQSEVSKSVDLNVQRDGLQSPPSFGGSIENLTYLKAKQLEYQKLLAAVNKELKLAP